MNRKMILIVTAVALVATTAYSLHTGDFRFLTPITILALAISTWKSQTTADI